MVVRWASHEIRLGEHRLIARCCTSTGDGPSLTVKAHRLIVYDFIANASKSYHMVHVIVSDSYDRHLDGPNPHISSLANSLPRCRGARRRGRGLGKDAGRFLRNRRRLSSRAPSPRRAPNVLDATVLASVKDRGLHHRFNNL